MARSRHPMSEAGTPGGDTVRRARSQHDSPEGDTAMNYRKALVAGVIGAAVMSIIMAMARALGMPVNLELMLGTMMGGLPSAAKWIMGLIIHLIAGGIF